jgi:glycosyltransferase involved in cell wall biosynthesis
MAKAPKISVITTNKNGGRFLRETVESVMMQTFEDYEHIIVDGGSTDDSLDILASYRHLRWISEPDRSPNDGFRKGFAMARGDYIMVMCVSDKYLSRTWFRRCVDVLDADPEVSLVWGVGANMSTDGDINSVWQPWWLDVSPPQKKDFFPFWLATNAYLPELNYCVRRPVFLECFPQEVSTDPMSVYNPFLGMLLNFNINGYLPYFLPVIAHCGRIHENQHGQLIHDEGLRTLILYRKLIAGYFFDVLFGRKAHCFRDGNSLVIGRLSRKERMYLPVDLVRHKLHLLMARTFRSRAIGKAMRRLLAS